METVFEQILGLPSTQYTTTCHYVTKVHRVREDHGSMMWSKASKWVSELRLFCYRYYFQRSGVKFFAQRRKLS